MKLATTLHHKQKLHLKEIIHGMLYSNFANKFQLLCEVQPHYHITV